MAIGRTNAGGGGFNKSVIIVTAPTGSTVTCTKGTTVKTATEKNGEWWFKNLDTGKWTLKATLSGQTATQIVNITQFGVYRITMAYRLYPDDFIISGTKGVDYEVVQDNDTVIPVEDYRKHDNWKIRILTSQTINPKKDDNIDVFLVGGGGNGASNIGGGGAGGYTRVARKIAVKNGDTLNATIGASGGATSFTSSVLSFSALSAYGGESANGNNGGNGGCGGGAGGAGGGINGGNGGSDGGSGSRFSGGGQAGIGQSTTTREFGETTGTLYSGAGGGGSGEKGSPGNGGSGGGGNGTNGSNPGGNGVTNTGGGGGGSESGTPGIGGSGIIIIRNAR